MQPVELKTYFNQYDCIIENFLDDDKELCIDINNSQYCIYINKQKAIEIINLFKEVFEIDKEDVEPAK